MGAPEWLGQPSGADAIRCNQMQSDAIRCKQMQADAIRCNQMQSDAIRCNQMQSVVGAPEWLGQPKEASQRVAGLREWRDRVQHILMLRSVVALEEVAKGPAGH